MDIIILSVIIISLIVFLFLISNPTLKASHKLLITFYIIILALFLNFYAFFHEIRWLYVTTDLISSGFGYLLGAIIYLYVISLFEKLNAKRIIYNLLPFLAYLVIVNVPFLFSNPKDGYLFEYLQYIQAYGDEVYLIELFVFFIYTLKAFRKNKRFSSLLNEYYSTHDGNHFNWVEKMLGGVFLFILVDLGLAIYLIFTHDDSLPEVSITASLAACITFYITYHGLYVSRVFIPNFLMKEQTGRQEQKKASPYRSPYTQAELEELNKKLELLLAQKKLFLNDSLTLSDLATEMSLSDKKLSDFINNELQKSFYKLINLYRLAEFKEQLLLPENKVYSIIALANLCGFKSKTSFYEFFKEQTGMTPSQYLKNSTSSNK